MRKFSAKWFPKCLNADQKRQRCQSSEQLTEFFSARSKWFDFMSRLVTMDETRLYHYGPETKQQSMEWRHSGSHRPKKLRVQISAGKFSPRFFGIKTASSPLIIFQRSKLPSTIHIVSATRFLLRCVVNYRKLIVQNSSWWWTITCSKHVEVN